jgi:uncharacterized protein involved in exopolysaccharide biosynthesis
MSDTSINTVGTQSVASDVDDEVSLLDLLQIVFDNLRLLVLAPLVMGILSLGLSFFVEPTFTAKTQFLPPQQQQSSAASMLASLGSLGGLAGGVAGLKNPADQYIAYLKSNSVQNALIERFKLKERYQVKTLTDARSSLSEKARASSGKDGLISLEVDDRDPQFAADLANAHIEELRAVLGRLAVTEAQQRRVFFEKQLALTKDNLIKAETALKSTGISDSALKANPTSAVLGVAALKAQVTAQEVKIGAMRGYLAESAPDFKQALNELASLRAQLSKLDKDDTRPGSNGGGDYISRFREFKYHETLLELFVKQYEIARVDEAREGSIIQVLDVALPPERKSKPKRALVAIMATLLTGFVVLVFVFVRHALRNAGRDPESASKIATLKASWRRAWGKSSH